MFKINNISNYPLQKKTLNLPDGNQVNLTLYFVPLQSMWVVRQLVYNDIEINNLSIVTNPNILREFKNIIPFGLCVTSTENRDPLFVDDFATGKNSMYILSAAEVQQYEDYLSGR